MNVPPDISDTHDSNTAFVLVRPIYQRTKEHKYRCAQAMIFGLPVLGLQWFGHSLGPAEQANRWIAILQALLAGWVIYVSASGMLAEGVMHLATGRRPAADFIIAVASSLIYLLSVVAALGVLFGHGIRVPMLFHGVVILLAGWCGLRWWWLARLGDSNSATGL